MDLERIRFKKGEMPDDIFSDLASEAADYIASSGNTNKTTQLRKFYDELVMWHDKVHNEQKEKREAKYRELAPYIKMLNAKVAYASGRKSSGQKLVNDNFKDLFSHCIRQIDDPETLRHCKLFMEALIGFRKAKENP